jgi:predicted porin
MQKKIIAMLVAGLVSGAAYAQTNVTVYGRLDASYIYSKSDFRKFQGIESGEGYGGGGSRLGFMGEEALGNGLKAIFKLEYGTTPDENAATFSNRYSYVGLTGGFGTLTLGRNGTPSDLWTGATGVNGISGIEPINLMRGKLGSKDGSGGNSILDGSRWDNSISYTSPNFSGLDFMAMYSFGEKVNSRDNIDGDGYSCAVAVTSGGTLDTATPTYGKRCYKGADTSDAGKLGLGIRYANGPLYLTAVYEAQADDDSAQRWADNWTRGYGAKGWAIGGAYDFKVVKLYANYFREKANHNGRAGATTLTGGITGGSDKQTTWSLGAGIPVSSAGTVMVEYAQLKNDLNGATAGREWGHKSKGYSVGYKHTLSKRTLLHAYVTRINNDRGIHGGWNKTGVFGEDQTTFSTGIVHLF